MRPVSLFAEVTAKLLDRLGYVVRYGVCLYLVRRFANDIEFPIDGAWIVGGVILATIAGRYTKSLRRMAALMFSKFLAGCAIRPLAEVGVWQLLTVAYRFWPKDPITDYAGMSALHEACDGMPPQRRKQLYDIVRRIESVGWSTLSPPAHEFLSETPEYHVLESEVVS